ncbi:hypothetical protein M5D96_013330, partial [Drosophila gunungcola]
SLSSPFIIITTTRFFCCRVSRTLPTSLPASLPRSTSLLVDDLRFALRLLTIKSHAAFLVSIITETKNTRSPNEAQTKKENERSEKSKETGRKKTQSENDDTSSNVSSVVFYLFYSDTLFLYSFYFLFLFPSACVCVCSLFLHFAFAQIVN